jgi:hypothetical protein
MGKNITNYKSSPTGLILESQKSSQYKANKTVNFGFSVYIWSRIYSKCLYNLGCMSLACYLSLALEFRIFGSSGGGGGAAEVEGLGPGGLGPGVLGSTIDCTGLGK